MSFGAWEALLESLAKALRWSGEERNGREEKFKKKYPTDCYKGHYLENNGRYNGTTIIFEKAVITVVILPILLISCGAITLEKP